MPFTHIAHEYQPEQLAKLTEAFDQAWPEVLRVWIKSDDDQVEWLRKRLANYIIACASHGGDFDPVLLCEKAIRALATKPYALADIEYKLKPISEVRGLAEAMPDLAQPSRI
jgi:hypothetical protein